MDVTLTVVVSSRDYVAATVAVSWMLADQIYWTDLAKHRNVNIATRLLGPKY